MLPLEISEKMLFALLRASLHDKEVELTFFSCVTEKDWEQCYLLAKSQGVMALAWDGIIKLPMDLQPPLELKMKWGVKVEVYEKKYQRYCKIAYEISEYYKRHQIATILLKGVGLSTLYPNPSHREGGDIDIYTCSMDKGVSDWEANRKADILMKEQGLAKDFNNTPKHSSFYYKDIPIENHKTFVNVYIYPIAKSVDDFLRKHLEPQSVKLMAGEVLVPSSTFNTLFVSFHAAQHFGSGLCIHHLCDWAVIVNRYGLHLPKELMDMRLSRAITAFTSICNDLLGTSVDVQEDKEFAEYVLNEILHPQYYNRPLPKSKLAVFWFKMKRLRYNHKLKLSMFKYSPWKRIYISIINHLFHPETIFN